MANRDDIDDPKRCGSCRERKPRSEFGKNKSRGDGLSPDCKACVSKFQATYRKQNKDKIRARARVWRYGVTREQLADLLAKQHGRCAICFKVISLDASNTHVDHDHETNRVRGLLCDRCNTGLGHFDEKAELLLMAVHYLDVSRGKA